MLVSITVQSIGVASVKPLTLIESIPTLRNHWRYRYAYCRQNSVVKNRDRYYIYHIYDYFLMEFMI